MKSSHAPSSLGHPDVLPSGGKLQEEMDHEEHKPSTTHRKSSLQQRLGPVSMTGALQYSQGRSRAEGVGPEGGELGISLQRRQGLAQHLAQRTHSVQALWVLLR